MIAEELAIHQKRRNPYEKKILNQEIKTNESNPFIVGKNEIKTKAFVDLIIPEEEKENNNKFNT